MSNEGVLRGGIDLGGTKIQAVVVDEHHVVLGQSRHPTPTTGGPQDVADAMVAAMTEAAGLGGIETDAGPAAASAHRATSIPRAAGSAAP